MADLRDVVGAILRDVTQARGQADEAVRDMAIAYARDPILRAFTIPRTEIRELRIDLRVAVNGVGESTNDNTVRQQRITEAIRAALKLLPYPVEEKTILVLTSLPASSLTKELIDRELEASAKSAATRDAETKPPRERQDILKKLLASYSEQAVKVSAVVYEKTKAILAAPSEKRISVEVITSELKDIPQHMISTISVTLDVNGILPTQNEEA